MDAARSMVLSIVCVCVCVCVCVLCLVRVHVICVRSMCVRPYYVGSLCVNVCIRCV